MTQTKKATRLSKIARELNVGISTIVDFLQKKGHDVESNPNTKIGPELYDLLVEEYSTDQNVKKESEKLNLRNMRSSRESISVTDMDEEEEIEAEEETSDEEEELFIKDYSVKKEKAREEEKVAETKEEPKEETRKPSDVKVVGKIDLDEAGKKKEEKKEEEQSPGEGKTRAQETEEVAEGPSQAKEEPTEEEKKEGELKVVGKIDLESLNQKTRPEKAKKKEKKEEKEEEKIDKKPVEKEEQAEPVEAEKKPEAPEKTAGKEIAEEKAQEDEKKEQPREAKKKDEDNFIKRRIEKLSGPTVVGKIDLPEKKEQEKKPVASSSDEQKSAAKKKKRRRIRKESQPVSLKDDKKKAQEEQKGKSKKKRKKHPHQPEVSEEEVQQQIKETLSRLTQKGKSKAAKYRREKRDAISQKEKEEQAKKEEEKSILKVTEFVTVNELATMMNVPPNDVISNCMNLGLFVSINQRLDAETISVLAEEYNYKVEFISADVQETIYTEEEEEPDDNLVHRPPVVTVMGHVDHGKTKLLDYVRNANVIAGEAGGITQHIGAYHLTLEDGREITFLDTPGHEAFTAMRARGAQITDVAIIVIAADDGVMPQTVEAINHAHAAGVPIVFAINKVDKPTANPEKIKEELANMNFLVEDWGGKYQSQEISAKQGMNIDDLLEKVLLEAELQELKANPDRNANGTIIESSLDKGRGYVATILVQNGTLQVGDIILSGVCTGHVKAMYNERGKQIDKVGPAMPALILGLNGAPQAGEQFHVMESDREAKEIANKREQLQREQGLRTQKHITLDEIGRRIAIGNFQELNVIVKGDVDGSVEALSDALIKLSTNEIQVNVIHKGVGQISETDVMLAVASNAIIVGFQVRPSAGARRLAEKEQIDIRLYSIIYDATNEIKDAMEGMLSPEIKEEILGTAEVKDIFKITKVGTVAGCQVREGKINRNARVRVIRDGIVVYTGELGSLKRFKEDVKEVASGYECGLNVENYNDVKVGDMIEAFQEVEVKKTLE